MATSQHLYVYKGCVHTHVNEHTARTLYHADIHRFNFTKTAGTDRARSKMVVGSQYRNLSTALSVSSSSTSLDTKLSRGLVVGEGT